MCGRDKNARAVGVAGSGWPLRGLSDGSSPSGHGSSILVLVLFPTRSAPWDCALDGSASGGADSVRG